MTLPAKTLSLAAGLLLTAGLIVAAYAQSQPADAKSNDKPTRRQRPRQTPWTARFCTGSSRSIWATQKWTTRRSFVGSGST